MSRYVLTLNRGRLSLLIYKLSIDRLCDYMHLKDLRQSEKQGAQNWFLLPACVLPWNVSPKKKVKQS